jgi:hypothetical protein
MTIDYNTESLSVPGGGVIIPGDKSTSLDAASVVGRVEPIDTMVDWDNAVPISTSESPDANSMPMHTVTAKDIEGFEKAPEDAYPVGLDLSIEERDTLDIDILRTESGVFIVRKATGELLYKSPLTQYRQKQPKKKRNLSGKRKETVTTMRTTDQTDDIITHATAKDDLERCNIAKEEHQPLWRDMCQGQRCFAKSDWTTTARVMQDTILAAGKPTAVLVYYDKLRHGPNVSLELTPTEAFANSFGDVVTHDATIHPSYHRYAFIRMTGMGDRDVTLHKHTPISDVKIFSGMDEDSLTLDWECGPVEKSQTNEVNSLEATPTTEEAGNLADTGAHQQAQETAANEPIMDEEDEETGATPTAGFEGLGTGELQVDFADLEEYENTSFEQGGPPRAWDHEQDEELNGTQLIKDLLVLGVDYSKSRDMGTIGEDGQPVELSRVQLRELCELARESSLVWSRNAKCPRPCRLQCSWVTIPTGDHAPIRQRPYPIPHKFLPAVKKEIEGLLKAGLIEPGYSDWASPVLCIVKKDTAKGATGEQIKLKLGIDFRKLNAASDVDTGSIGDQYDILDAFNSNPYVSLCDAAGGYYQFQLHPSTAHKTCMVLPTSAGGSSFIWKVAPYGLARMPATYSRVVMFVLRGMDDVNLGHEPTTAEEVDDDTTDDQGLGEDSQSTSEDVQIAYDKTMQQLRNSSYGSGTVRTWLDDITVMSGRNGPGLGFAGHIKLLKMVFQRLISAGMTLKGEKAHILRPDLEVLGYIVTPEGLKPHPDKVQAINDMPKDGLRDQKEVLRFLGMVNFYRRFVHQLSTKAEPLFRLLKKDTPRGTAWPWGREAQTAYEGVKLDLKNAVVQAHPDLKDPYAEYVMMTDASKLAAGAVLFQWQRKHDKNEPWPANLKFKNGPDAPEFATMHKDRLAAGYRLVCIGYFSKTFHESQKNWATFDKEAGAILLACAQWRRLITGRPCTVYTDNTVAKSLLYNYSIGRPPRLQRWGIELGTYLPYLRVAYRKGELNPVADYLSRYQASAGFTAEQVAEYDDNDLYWKLASVKVDGKEFDLFEPTIPEKLGVLWESCEEKVTEMTEEEAQMRRRETEARLMARDESVLQAFTAQWQAGDADFAAEEEAAEGLFNHWERYVDTFKQTYGRVPVVYDLFTGEGGSARGAATAGCEVHGFDHCSEAPGYRHRPIRAAVGQPLQWEELPRMHYHQEDLDDEGWWERLMSRGHADGVPKPDLIHGSPPCALNSKLRSARPMPKDEADPREHMLEKTLNRLAKYTAVRLEKDKTFVPYTVENSPAPRVRDIMQEGVVPHHCIELCGTQFGHRVFRHRLIASNVPLVSEGTCRHEGKTVGSNGLNRKNRPKTEVPPNMYGLYSRYQKSRGTMEELHQAMGFDYPTFSYDGLVQALPAGYGRYLAGQMVAHCMSANVGMPLVRADEGSFEEEVMLDHWAEVGYTQPSLFANLAEEPHTSREYEAMEATLMANMEAASVAEWESPFLIELADQLRDPELRDIHESLTSARRPDTDAGVVALRQVKNQELYTIHDGVVKIKTQLGLRVMVPTEKRWALVKTYHTLPEYIHAGRDRLYARISAHFHWYGMLSDCARFIKHCEVCGDRQVTGFSKTSRGLIPIPDHPFHTLYIDHKGPLLESGGYKYILVVVCGLTGYTVYIPTKDQKAETTFNALVSRVCSIFGYPKMIVADNAFRSALAEACSKYMGFRMAHVAPYSPQSNSLAENAVKRISHAIHKHTDRHKDWHAGLPVLASALNSMRMKSTGVSPFEAVFGRPFTGMAELENERLTPVTHTGHEQVDSLAFRLRQFTKIIQDRAKRVRVDIAQRAGRYAGPDKWQDLKKGDWIFLRHGGHEHSTMMRRHGLPALRAFQVLDVYLEVGVVRLDTGKTTILPIQNLRHCLRAPDSFWVFDDNSLPSGRSDGEKPTKVSTVRDPPTEVGGRMATPVIPGELPVFPVETVLQARSVGKNKWQYLIAWKGWEVPTWQEEKTLSDAGEFVRAGMQAARDAFASDDQAQRQVQVQLGHEPPSAATTVELLPKTVAQYGPFAMKEISGKLRFLLERSNSRGYAVRRWVAVADLDEDEKARVNHYRSSIAVDPDDLAIYYLFAADETAELNELDYHLFKTDEA